MEKYLKKEVLQFGNVETVVIYMLAQKLHKFAQFVNIHKPILK